MRDDVIFFAVGILLLGVMFFAGNVAPFHVLYQSPPTHYYQMGYMDGHTDGHKYGLDCGEAIWTGKPLPPEPKWYKSEKYIPVPDWVEADR